VSKLRTRVSEGVEPLPLGSTDTSVALAEIAKRECAGSVLGSWQALRALNDAAIRRTELSVLEVAPNAGFVRVSRSGLVVVLCRSDFRNL
jgi:hypothetical protein